MCEKEAVIVVRPEFMSMKKYIFIFPFSLTRINEEARKAQELAQLTSELQETRAQREQEVQSPVNTLYQEEIFQRQRELAQLAMCGQPHGHPPPS